MVFSFFPQRESSSVRILPGSGHPVPPEPRLTEGDIGGHVKAIEAVSHHEEPEQVKRRGQGQLARTAGIASSRYHNQNARRAATSVSSTGCQFKAPAAALAHA